MEQTSLEELKRTAASGVYRRIPIWREIFSDIATPVQVLKKLLAVSDHCFLLESAEDNKQWGRYSFSWVRSCDGADLHEPSGDNYN